MRFLFQLFNLPEGLLQFQLPAAESSGNTVNFVDDTQVRATAVNSGGSPSLDWMDGSSRVTRKPVTITKASAVFSPTAPASAAWYPPPGRSQPRWPASAPRHDGGVEQKFVIHLSDFLIPDFVIENNLCPLYLCKRSGSRKVWTEREIIPVSEGQAELPEDKNGKILTDIEKSSKINGHSVVSRVRRLIKNRESCGNHGRYRHCIHKERSLDESPPLG